MNGRKHIHRVAALLTAVAALAFFAGSVQAANSSPAGMRKAEYRALMLRSEALNRQYGLGCRRPAGNVGGGRVGCAHAQGDPRPRRAVRGNDAVLRRCVVFAPAAGGPGPGRALRGDGGDYLGPGSSSYTPPQALRALGERWQAVVRYEQQAQLEQARRQAAAFSWADAGIGALAATGVVALLGLGALGLRSRTPGAVGEPGRVVADDAATREGGCHTALPVDLCSCTLA